MLLKSLYLLFLAAIAFASELQIGILTSIPEDKCKVKSKPGDLISVHYEGKLEDGTVFDSSYSRGQPISFQLGIGQVIQGWDQGLTRMCIGEKRKLTIPSHLAYGDRGVGPIPAKATLGMFYLNPDFHLQIQLLIIEY